VDYYKISLTDTIGVIDSVTVYQNCFNYNGVSNPSYDPNNSFCQLIGRQTTDGGRAYTAALYSNLGTLDTKGLDFTLNWRSSLDDVFGHNLPAGYDFSSAFSMRLGVDNLMNRQPPVVGAQPGVTDGAGNTNASVYDVLGRRYYVSLKAKF
jgi:outer membrane receptor protein involved in Fe transport